MDIRIHSNYEAHSYGYYLLRLTKINSEHVVASNTERAFVISQLQDLLSLRSLLEDPLARQRLAAHLDLLAYSILPSGIQLVIFSIARQSVEVLGDIIARKIDQFQSEYGTKIQSVTLPAIERLDGPHHALRATMQLHVLHTDWEYDRYSSIGFYLHDRRGDWMRTWRLVHLYESRPELYERYLTELIQNRETALHV